MDTNIQEPLSAKALASMQAWWQAANYLSVGQVYLLDNPLLREPLTLAHIKPRLLGHFGTVPGLNFIYLHLNRVIKALDANVLFIAGPGHGAPGVVASAWLDGTYSEVYPGVSQDEAGMCRLFRQFSFPGGIPSHAAPQTPGSIHEGGELGYSLSHAFGAVLDNPDLVAACVVGDGEAETGPLATSWHGNKFLDPVHDGAVLPILHLNGYKIANPTVLARMPPGQLKSLLEGFGYAPIFVEGSDPAPMHRAMASAMDHAFAAIGAIQHAARHGAAVRQTPQWPMIVLRSPKGWTGPKTVDGLKTEGSWRSHQVPISDMEKPGHVAALETWLRSYHPDELFDRDGRPRPDIAALAPSGTRRMSANPHANGGALRRDLVMPDFTALAVSVTQPGQVRAEATFVMGCFLRDIMRLNLATRNFRIVGPDETASNRLQALFEVTGRSWDAPTIADDDEHLSVDGRVMEILSEHTCQGWLEGYLLTGRHGLFSCYEAFIHLVDSMVNQHAKWLKTSREVPWRQPIASLNYLLTSHVWRQDHNGFSHQDPGFIDHVVNKKADTVRVYLPPDANTLLCVTDHCLRSWDRINVIVAGKQPELQWLDMPEAIAHCARGIGVWEWASDPSPAPDVVMACAGDVPTLECLAAVELLREHVPGLAVRVVNVVDLMTLEANTHHPHGLPDDAFDAIFTADKPVIFAFHGYPALIHALTYTRSNARRFHVHGFIEEGTTTTPFDMVVRNRLDRFHLMLDAVERAAPEAAPLIREKVTAWLEEHERYIVDVGNDLPGIRDWRWRLPGGEEGKSSQAQDIIR
jgi:xylulose-5-phosphate/fructose-6-phosphate phosphoketolase